MLRICFVKHGTAYDARYVNVLADMISRNLEAGTPGTFELFTDDPTDTAPHINIHPIPEGFEGWWVKLWLFKDGHFDDGDRIVYFDLDTVILGRLDEVVKYDGGFAALRDFFKPYNDVQSAVMAWPANTLQFVLDKWNDMGQPILPAGDQQLIQMAMDEHGQKVDFWQDMHPGLFVSYKGGSYRRVPPRGCSVVCFHGQPKPHNCNSEWVNGVWQINGTQAFEIEQFCNTEDAQIEANIRYAMSLDYPWLEPKPAHEGLAVIVGGSPDLNDTYAEIPSLGGVVFGCNNTTRFLQERGIAVDYHVMVDAREENAKFLTSDRPSLGYLLASQCNRNVFDGVEGEAVTVWHPKIKGIVELVQNDERPKCIVGGGSTVCLKAISIAYVLGFRRFHLFGMASSMSNGEHHAYAQKQNDEDIVLKVQVDDREFITTPWMVAQADEFEDLLVELMRLGCEFSVSGDGLIPYILEETQKGVSPSAADARAMSILSRLPDDDTVTGAEIGVFAGELSSRLLSRDGLTLYMVDSWKGDGANYPANSDDFHATLTQDAQDYYMRCAIAATRFANDRAKVIATDSASAAGVVPDGTLDFVFIDADHSYEGCARDIALWYHKLKPNGLLSGHDYDHPEYPSWGVKQAVDEWAKAHGYSVELGENFTWFIRLRGEARIAA